MCKATQLVKCGAEISNCSSLANSLCSSLLTSAGVCFETSQLEKKYHGAKQCGESSVVYLKKQTKKKQVFWASVG